MASSDLTPIDADGRARMVDVSEKAVDRGMTVDTVRLIEKWGGASGDWMRA